MLRVQVQEGTGGLEVSDEGEWQGWGWRLQGRGHSQCTLCLSEAGATGVGRAGMRARGRARAEAGPGRRPYMSPGVMVVGPGWEPGEREGIPDLGLPKG